MKVRHEANTRVYTDELLSRIEDVQFTHEEVLLELLKWLPESTVEEFCNSAPLFHDCDDEDARSDDTDECPECEALGEWCPACAEADQQADNAARASAIAPEEA